MPILGTCVNNDCHEPIPRFGETEDGRIAYVPHTCPVCKTKQWTIVSRIDPQTFHEAEFLRRFDVNSKELSVEPKPGYNHYGYLTK